MNQTCTIKPFIDQSPTGPIYGTPYTSKCRYEDKRKLITDNNGKQKVSVGTIYLIPSSANQGLLVDSQITINSNTLTIMMKAIQVGFGPTYVECLLK